MLNAICTLAPPTGLKKQVTEVASLLALFPEWKHTIDTKRNGALC